jgi:hypothetical protein
MLRVDQVSALECYVQCSLTAVCSKGLEENSNEEMARDFVGSALVGVPC